MGTETDDAYGFHNWSTQKATENWVKWYRLIQQGKADHEFYASLGYTVSSAFHQISGPKSTATETRRWLKPVL